ncbi:sensor domain-containing diguanylate cyclase [Hydrogenovibrio thermophilus]|uniref:diguanylate cyclase n=1 Tax=Hydrogenovibrio thermophilus TaxID=265883 RepID=A0A451G511_9GAMM|nr:sensor domain-containing diguanylate cyclase [Hydrogenovibrio thermophilus]QAB14580.1 sensor domain-containing diguanylate cyclase [Hydrogenovibrio thermophilus]
MKTPIQSSLVHRLFAELETLFSSNGIILILVILLTITMNAVSFVSIKWLQTEWADEYSLYEAKDKLYFDLYRESGYGGFIHHFKNTVLRNDEVPLKHLSNNYQAITQNLTALQNMATSPEEKRLIRQIEETFQEYWEKLPILEQAVRENWSAKKTDRLVKVSDRAALQALDELVKVNQKLFNASFDKNQALIDNVRFYQTLSLTVLLLLSLLLLLFLKRKAGLVKKVQSLQKEILCYENLYEGTLDSMVDACIITDATGIIENFNEITLQTFGYESHELMGQRIEILIPEGEHKQHHADYMKSASMRKKVLFKGRELKAQKKDGSEISVEITVTPLSVNGQLKFVGIIHDITDRMKLMEQLGAVLLQLRNEATKDYLTGLMNRKAFFEHAEKVWSLAKRNHEPLCMLMLDIDLFKEINDTYGHNSGDRVLKGLAELFEHECRKEDLICRYGGEEFLILLESQPAKGAMEFANRIRQAVEVAEMDIGEGVKIQITVSIGLVAVECDEIPSMEEMISLADKVLYQAKTNGRNQVAENILHN